MAYFTQCCVSVYAEGVLSSVLCLQELKLIGEFGLRNKREVWRVKYTLANIRKVRLPTLLPVLYMLFTD